MNKALRWIYSRYCLLIFALIFLVMTPLFWVFIQKPSWKTYALKLNHWWAVIFFKLSAIPAEQVYRSNLSPRQQFVFCANHTSYLDIPLIGLNSNKFVFVGKSSIAKVPLFGYMYRNIHITVDRDRLRSKYQTLKRAEEEIEKGHSLVMFPEGGIGKNPPRLSSFKDGPFRVAIEKQIPVVPVTIPFNWIILPNHSNLMVHRRKAVIIYHPPVSTVGLTPDDTDTLKDKVSGIINAELTKYYPHGH